LFCLINKRIAFSSLPATRPSTATGASTTVAPKRANSANRPSTADTTSRAARSSATESASGTAVREKKRIIFQNHHESYTFLLYSRLVLANHNGIQPHLKLDLFKIQHISLEVVLLR